MGVQIVKLLGSAVDVNVNVNPAGAYDGGTTYNTGDVVEYNGSSYIAKQGTTGNLPTDTTYWQILAEKGDTGATGATGDTGPAGADGTGWTGGSYDAGTGVVTFTSDDALGFSTGDLRGADGADGADGLGVPAGGTTGQILSKVSNADNDTTWSDAPSGTLDGLTDTTLTSPADGEVLQYDSGTSKWVNATASGGGGGVAYDIIVDAAGGGDYTTLGAAITALSADDKRILVKAGSYTESAITIAYDNIEIHGEGQYKSIITGSSFRISINSGKRVSFFNIGFNSTTTYSMISYSSPARGTIQHCYFAGGSGSSNSAVYAAGNDSYHSIDTCEFNLTNGGAAVATSGTFTNNEVNIIMRNGTMATFNNDAYVSGNRFYRLSGTTTGVMVGLQHNAVFVGNTLSFGTAANNTATGLSNGSATTTSIGNNITGFHKGISGYGLISGNTITIPSQVTSTSPMGIYVWTNDATISDNIIKLDTTATTTKGIYVEGRRAKIRGNTITSSSVSANRDGIVLGSVTGVRAIISGNIIYNQATGINISADSTNSIVTENVCESCTTAITDNGTTTTLANNVT